MIFWVFASLIFCVLPNVVLVSESGGTNAFLSKVSRIPRQDVHQWNVQVVVPSGQQVPQKSPQPEISPSPGFVWVQVPISQFPSTSTPPQQNPVNSHPVTEEPQGLPPGVLADTGPQTFGPVYKGPNVPPAKSSAPDRKICLRNLRGQLPSDFCNKFVNCWDGVANEQECPDGLLFSSKGYCDHPENVNCNGRLVPGGTTSSATMSNIEAASQSPSTYLGINPSTLDTIVTSPTSAAAKKVNPTLRAMCFKPRGQFPSTSCNKYVNCWDDTVLEQDCPDGLLFSSKGYCDYPNNVDCGQRSIKQKISGVSKSDCPLAFGTFRNRTKCNSYFTCISNKIVADYTCPEGFMFNDNIGVCDYEYRVDCSKEPLIFQIRKKEDSLKKEDISNECLADFGTFRDAKNCAVYYTCVSNKIVGRSLCPSGFNFNDDIGVCDYSERIDCSKPVKMFQVKNHVLPQIEPDMMEKISTCIPGSVFPLNQYCTVACICREGVAEIVQCPAGLGYDSASDKCVLPKIAKC